MDMAKRATPCFPASCVLAVLPALSGGFCLRSTGLPSIYSGPHFAHGITFSLTVALPSAVTVSSVVDIRRRRTPNDEASGPETAAQSYSLPLSLQYPNPCSLAVISTAGPPWHKDDLLACKEKAGTECAVSFWSVTSLPVAVTLSSGLSAVPEYGSFSVLVPLVCSIHTCAAALCHVAVD